MHWRVKGKEKGSVQHILVLILVDLTFGRCPNLGQQWPAGEWVFERLPVPAAGVRSDQLISSESGEGRSLCTLPSRLSAVPHLPSSEQRWAANTERWGIQVDSQTKAGLNHDQGSRIQGRVRLSDWHGYKWITINCSKLAMAAIWGQLIRSSHKNPTTRATFRVEAIARVTQSLVTSFERDIGTVRWFLYSRRSTERRSLFSVPIHGRWTENRLGHG